MRSIDYVTALAAMTIYGLNLVMGKLGVTELPPLGFLPSRSSSSGRRGPRCGPRPGAAGPAVRHGAVAVSLVSYTMRYPLVRRHPVNQAMPFPLLVPIFGIAATIAGAAITVPRRSRQD